MSTINLSKGAPPVRLIKTRRITVQITWPAATDYDLYALVLDRDGTVHHVAMFGARGIDPQRQYKGIYHASGDAGRSSGATMAEETLTIELDDTIAAVLPVAYSAQSNGNGSFPEYQVKLTVDNGAGGRIEQDASNAPRLSNGKPDRKVYTCCPALILNNTDGTFDVDPIETYSASGNENRPNLVFEGSGLFGTGEKKVVVKMNAGPRNNYK